MAVNPTLTTERLLAEAQWLERLALQLCADPATAEDLVQDTMLAALRRAPAVVHSRAWLATVARRLSRRRAGREAGRPAVERSAARSEALPGSDQLVEKAMVSRAVVDAVVGLAEPYRTAILLRYLEDLPVREVARRCGVPRETARTRIKRGLAQLRGQLDRRYGSRRAWALPLAAGSPVTATLFGAVSMSLIAKSAAAAAVAVAALLVWYAVPEPGRVPDLVQRVDEPPPDRRSAVAGAKEPDPDPERRALASAAGIPVPGRTVVTGRVVDEQWRRPLVGFAVRWAEVAPESGRHPAAEQAVTDAAGRFELSTAVAEPWKHLELVVAAPERAPEWASEWASEWALVEQALSPGNATGPGRLDVGEIAVPPGTGIRGRVVDAGGRPVPDAGLFALRHWSYVPTEQGVWMPVPRLLRATPVGETGPDGSFVLTTRLVPRGRDERLLAVGAAGVGWLQVKLSRGRADLEVELPLQPSAGVEVQVVDRQGAPVAGARVVAEPRFRPLSADNDRDLGFEAHPRLAAHFTAVTGGDGRARIAGLPLPEGKGMARYSIRVEAASRVVRRRGVDLREDDVVQVVLPGPEGYAVRGVVRDPDGAGLPEVRVTALFGARVEATTDAQGRYEITGLPGDGGPLELAVAASGYTGYRTRQRLPEGEQSLTIDPVIAPAAALFGVVTDRSGAPIAGVEVSRPRRGQSAQASSTDRQGRFRIPDLAIAEVHPLYLRSPGPGFQDSLKHYARTGDSPLTLVLPRLPAGGAKLRVTLLDGQGAPLDPGEVRLQSLDEQRGASSYPATGVIGRVTASGLVPGRFELRVEPPRGHPLTRTFTVDEADREVRFDLEQGPSARVDGVIAWDGDAAGERRPPRLQLHFVGPQRARFAEPDGTPRTAHSGRVLDVDTRAGGELRFVVVDVDPRRDLVVEVAGGGPWGGQARIRAAAGSGNRLRLLVGRNGTVQLRSTVPWPTQQVVLYLRVPGEDWGEPWVLPELAGKTRLFEWPLRTGRWEWRAAVPPEGRTNAGGPRWQSGAVEVVAGQVAPILITAR